MQDINSYLRMNIIEKEKEQIWSFPPVKTDGSRGENKQERRAVTA